MWLLSASLPSETPVVCYGMQHAVLCNPRLVLQEGCLLRLGFRARQHSRTIVITCLAFASGINQLIG
jgi:hypothetical protein